MMTGRGADYDSGIDLIEWIGVLWKKKWLIGGVVAVVMLVAIAYALLATPVYKAQAEIFPPEKTDLQVLDSALIRMVVTSATPIDVFASVKRKLDSKALRRDLFDAMGLNKLWSDKTIVNQPADWVFQEFDEKISIQYPKVDEKQTYISSRIIIFLEGEDPELITNVINQMVERAERSVVTDIVQNIRIAANLRIADLEREIKSLRKMATKKRLDRIVQLEDAGAIARQLGLGDPITFNLGKISAATPTESQVLSEIAATGDALYMRGLDAIDAEIKQLSERESDDPYIGSLRDKEAELAKLRMIQITPEEIRAARLDQPAFAPKNRLKPQRAKIVILGGFFGLFLGSALAVLFQLVQTQPRKEKDA